MHALCGLNVIPHWLNRSSTLAVQKIFNGNKCITPKYKYKSKYLGCKYKYKYKYSKNVLKYMYKYQVPHLWSRELPPKLREKVFFRQIYRKIRAFFAFFIIPKSRD